ncbi:MAG TPA: YaiI/YqxD family protein [Bacillota bacterium]|nr:YaiI/YqxD family protein [Bacillota bacterium]
MKIYVDADACPVEKEVIQVARAFRISVVLIKSYAHFSHEEKPSFVETVYVDAGADSADYKLLEQVKRGDIVVTQDYGLASLCLAKGCIVLHHRGFLFTENNIDRLLATRHQSAQVRRAGGRTKGPRAFTTEDREKFSWVLERILQNH